MKIHPDQLEGVRPDKAPQTNRVKPPSTAFGDLLNQEVAKSSAEPAKSTATLPPPGGLGNLGALFSATTVEAVAPVPKAEKAIMDKVENLLDKWDQYARNLKSTSNASSLKQAYGVLDDIDGTVRQIKADNPDLAQKHPALQGMVAELEVLTVTERFKFNREGYYRQG